MLNLVILPIECDDKSILTQIQKGVSIAFPNLSCSIGPGSKGLLEGCFNSKRGQYNASRVLQKMSRQVRLHPRDSFLGVTSVDLYVPDMNFVFGLAGMSERVGLISLNRLKSETYGGEPDHVLFVDRAVKEAVHEMGHVFGLSHCRRSSCVMYFSNSIYDTDRKGRVFCSSCKANIDKTLS